MRNAGSAILEEMLEPVTRCFNTDAARALVSLRLDDRVRARVDELAERCNQGQLSAEEMREYDAYINASTLIGILQSEARRVLADAGAE